MVRSFENHVCEKCGLFESQIEKEVKEHEEIPIQEFSDLQGLIVSDGPRSYRIWRATKHLTLDHRRLYFEDMFYDSIPEPRLDKHSTHVRGSMGDICIEYVASKIESGIERVLTEPEFEKITAKIELADPKYIKEIGALKRELPQKYFKEPKKYFT